MAKNKTTENNLSVDDYINNITDEKRQNDVRELVKIFEATSGFPPKMWGEAILDLEVIITNMKAVTRATHLWPDFQIGLLRSRFMFIRKLMTRKIYSHNWEKSKLQKPASTSRNWKILTSMF